MTDPADLEARIEALEARVLELEEDRAIRDLLARYGFTADTCQDEAFVELYTSDGRMKVAANANARKNFGVDEWIVYLMTSGQEETLAAYGADIIPAVSSYSRP